VTENQTPTDLQEHDLLEPPAASATADALESVASTEQGVDTTSDDAEAAAESTQVNDAEVAAESTSVDEAEVAAESTSVDDVEVAAESTSAEDVEVDEDQLEPGQTEVPVGDEVVIDDETMRRALEAILMVTDEPLPVLTLARTVGRPTGDISAALTALADEYTEQGRGFDLREVGGGWRYYTRAEAAQYVERFVLDGQQARLTQAALETLAVVAYKQPVSRARVSAIRGVNVDGVMRTLVSRGLVEEAGADTESQATLYRTTSYFLERMGMQGLDDLPELAPYLPEMDDMEEELAAQNATANPGIVDPEAPADAAPTAETEPTAGTGPTVGTEPLIAAEPVAEVGEDGNPVVEGESAVEGEPAAEAGDLEEEGGELEPAEELEAGGDGEIGPDLDPAEFPETGDGEAANGKDGGGKDGGGTDETGDDLGAGGDADGDLDADLGVEGDFAIEENSTGEGEGEVAVVDGADDADALDDADEVDESADDRLEAAEDLEAAGGSEAAHGAEVAGETSQYRTGSTDDD
jgi:segregation and condensation protein B